MEELKAYPENENPQIDQSEEQQALHEKFFKEVEAVGQEQIKHLEDREKQYDEI